MMEKGRFDQEILDLVKGPKNLPLDVYHEYVADRRDHENRLLMFSAQAILSFGVVVFSMVMIGKNGIDAAYFGTISGVLGYWLPSPMSSRPVAKKTVAAIAVAP
jgi:hypothetical protein